MAPERRPAALVRLTQVRRARAGRRAGARARAPTRIARARSATPRCWARAKAEVEKNLGNSAFYLDGIEKLFQKYQVAGYEAALAQLKTQVAAYDDVRAQAEVLPRARDGLPRCPRSSTRSA